MKRPQNPASDPAPASPPPSMHTTPGSKQSPPSHPHPVKSQINRHRTRTRLSLRAPLRHASVPGLERTKTFLIFRWLPAVKSLKRSLPASRAYLGSGGHAGQLTGP